MDILGKNIMKTSLIQNKIDGVGQIFLFFKINGGEKDHGGAC